MGERKTMARLVALAGMVALVAAACGSGRSGSSKAGGVDITLKDFGISSDLGTVKSGKVTFNIKNAGPSQHEFVVIKSDLSPTQVPMTQEQGVPIVDEEGVGLEGIGEKEDINPGASTFLTLTLAPGRYLLICNLPSHYKLGMVSAVTVAA